MVNCLTVRSEALTSAATPSLMSYRETLAALPVIAALALLVVAIGSGLLSIFHSGIQMQTSTFKI